MYFLVNKNTNIIFGFTPKCGCQHIRNLFNFLNGNNEKPLFSEKRSSLPKDYKNYHIIIIIRNPYERMVSGFREKYNNTNVIKSLQKIKTYTLPDINYNKLKFSTFVNELDTNGLKNIDKHHFNLQTSDEWDDKLLDHKLLKVYDIKNIDYSYIGELYKIEIPDNVIKFRGNHNDRNTEIYDGNVYDILNINYRNRKVLIKQYYNEDIVNKVTSFYKNDFKILKQLGFDYESPI
jgi:hypothetical protein